VDFLKEQLIAKAYFKDIVLCKGTQATFANFKEALGKFSYLTHNDLLLVYFSGHGTAFKKDNESKRFYFFYEVKYGNDWTYISEDDLKNWLSKIKARKILVLDTCYSGMGKSVLPIPNTKVSVLPDSFDPGPVDIIISACKANEIAYDGILADSFGKALEKADKNNDGIIMISEIYNYIAEDVSSRKNDQHPQISPENYTDFPLIEDIGIIEIDSAPIRGVEVYLNGEYIGKTPIKDKEYKPGTYEVELKYGKISKKSPPLTIQKGLNIKKIYEFDVCGKITGRIVCEGTLQPVNGAEITPIGPGVFGATSNQDGEFEINVKPGQYRGIIVMGAKIESTTIRRDFVVEEGEIYSFGNVSVPLIPAKQASLEVITNIPWASVFINGKLKEDTGKDGKLLLKLNPGKYEVTVKKDGYYPDSRRISLNTGEEKKVEITLIPKQPQPPMKVAIGLGNPYISLKVGQKWHIEARYAMGSGIKVLSGRLLRDFSQTDKKKDQNFNIFAGIEGGTISFDNTISGKGGFGYLFVGGEYFITDKIAFLLDMGPASINLKEDKTSISASSLEYMVNLGINFYLR